MSIKFKEIRQYVARNIRLSICFEDGYYDNYTLISDIPNGKYDDMFVYGVGKIDVEFPLDVYAKSISSSGFRVREYDIFPALEIVLWDRQRDDIHERKEETALKFGDLKGYLQVFGHMSVVMQKDWSSELFEKRDDIPKKYDEYFVYGIGMEDDPEPEEYLKNAKFDTSYKKRMVIVLSEEPRADIVWE